MSQTSDSTATLPNGIVGDPSEKPLDRDELLTCFVTVLNVCEPDHPDRDDPYPIARTDVEYGYHQHKRGAWASCGPRADWRANEVAYNVDRKYVNSISTERHLALLTHEVSHVTEAGHTSGPGHNKAFWREMVFNAWQVRENLEAIEDVMGPVDKDEYIEEVIEDPNSSTVDQRIESVAERKQEMAELMGWHDYEIETSDDPDQEIDVAHAVETVAEELIEERTDDGVSKVASDSIRFEYDATYSTDTRTVHERVFEVTDEAITVGIYPHRDQRYSIARAGNPDHDVGTVVSENGTDVGELLRIRLRKADVTFGDDRF